MSSLQHNFANWHLLADNFIWYDRFDVLSLIPENVTDEEIKKYLYVYHGDTMSIEEIREWRGEKGREHNSHKRMCKSVGSRNKLKNFMIVGRLWHIHPPIL